jgi:predicted transcriptional regulator
MTMMGILEQKGHLKRSADGRAYVYRPAQPKAKVVGNMVQDFVKRVFDGSAQPLLVHLVESPEIDEDQLKQIEALLRERRRKQ